MTLSGVQMRKFVWLLSWSLFSALAMTIVVCPLASACAYWPVEDGPLEERIAEQPMVFIGRVTSVGDNVTFAVEEVFLGDVAKTYQVRQGHGRDCRREFEFGEKVFFAGASVGAPTIKISDGIPEELLSIIGKLRRHEPLRRN
jgi:hypothetical protein